jgi:hypothetical protein
VLVKGGCGRLREVVRGLAGGVQLLEQGQELVAEGILDAGELVGVLGAEDGPQPLGFRVAPRRRPLRLRAPRNWARVSFAALAGVGARVRMTRASALVRPPFLPWKASKAAG